MHRLRTTALVLVALLLAGCATTSVFYPYPMQAEKFRRGLTTPETGAVLAALERKRGDADRLLYLMERGRIAQLTGDFAASKTDFEQAIAAFREIEDRARLSLSEAGATGTALLTNDNAIPYKGYAYERVLVHQFQALNYLALGDREGTAVEMRAAQQFQRQAELQYADELSKAQGEATQNKILLSEFDNHFAGMDAVTGALKNSFQNGYTFYTSAAIWEAFGESNDALVDYKKALELAPDNTALQRDVVRVSESFEKPAARRPGEGTVVVLYEQGFVPAKRGININIPTTDGGWFSVAFPVYTAEDHLPATPLTVSAEDQSAQTFLLSDTSALAVKALKEQIPAMLVRQVLRARAKYEMQKQATKQGGLGAQFLTNIYNLVSEQADLRSWLTLPANAQAARIALPAGPRLLTLSAGPGSLSVPVTVRAGRTTLLRVVETSGRLITQVYEP